MKINVRIPTQLRSLCDGEPEVTVEANSVGEALVALNGVNLGFSDRLYDETGNLRRFVNIFVEEEDIRFLDGLNTELRDGQTVSITGISKGAGMIRPNMATMLGFMATDAGIAAPLLQQLVREAADKSFNCITVDGDTSTNDSFILIATGQAGLEFSEVTAPGYAALRDAVIAVAVELAQAIVRDGEGATKFITVAVEGGKDSDECKQVGYAIGHSPLVKTAFFASDPNLGRILAAIGYAGIGDLDVNSVRVWLASAGEEILVAENGGRAASYREEEGSRIMQQAEIVVRVDLGRGAARGTVYTCDFSYDYVKINAEYRS